MSVKLDQLKVRYLSPTQIDGNVLINGGTISYKTANYISNPILVLDDGTSYGHTIILEGGGTTYIGAGEAATGLYNYLGTKSTEDLILCADGSIKFYTNCQTPSSSKGAILNNNLSLYPMINNTGTIGLADYKWENIYATNYNGTKVNLTTASVTHGAFFESRTGGSTVWFGVGDGNINHGVYSDTLNKWIVYADNEKVYLTGNADSATILQTARTLTVGSTGKSFNGSANVSWSHAEIGATVSNAWANGTTTGPTLTTTVNGVTGSAVAVPAATSSISGIVTTADQSFRGMKTFYGPVRGYMYNITNNAPAFIFDKPGSHWTGIGANSENNTIFLGPCAEDANVAGGWSWIANFNQTWKFQGYLKVLGGTIYLNNDSTEYINTTDYTGNAATATILKTTRSITIGDTAKNFNGSANVSWTTQEIGAVRQKAYYAAIDANTLYDTGVYTIGGGQFTNGPTSYGYGQLLVLSYRKHTGNTTPDHAGQLFIHGGGGYTTQGVLCFRASGASEWWTWQMCAHGDASTQVGSSTAPVYMANNGTITACGSTLGVNITGNAATATKLKNYYSGRPTSIAPGISGDGSMFHFKCTSSVTDTTTDPGDAHILHFNWDNTGGYDYQIAALTTTSTDCTLKYRSMANGTWNTWVTSIDSGNYTSYKVTKTGGGASGTWGISISGTAAKATADANGANIANTYLKRSGGYMTGNIGYTGTHASYEMIRFIDNASDDYGNGIAIGGGGAVIIGGGESASQCQTLLSNGGEEVLYLANDTAIKFYTNCQSGIASAICTTLTADGSLELPNQLRAGSNIITTSASGGETSVRVTHGPGEYFYLFGNNSSGIRGIYDTTKGYIIYTTDTSTTFYGSLSGNASSATKATQDGSGNTITSTYLKLSGGTMTGSLTISHATSATVDATTTNPRIIFSESGSQPVMLVYSDYDSYRAPAGLKVVGGSSASPAWFEAEGDIYGAKVHGAVWNDYAEYRSAETIEPGRVVQESADGIMKLTTHRLAAGCEIVSDTFGFSIGETDNCKTPVAASGRVLAYTFEDRDSFELGQAVCSGPNGTVSKMTREEIMMYPERIIGTVSEIPTYTTWGTGNVDVNGRIWIRIR